MATSVAGWDTWKSPFNMALSSSGEVSTIRSLFQNSSLCPVSSGNISTHRTSAQDDLNNLAWNQGHAAWVLNQNRDDTSTPVLNNYGSDSGGSFPSLRGLEIQKHSLVQTSPSYTVQSTQASRTSCPVTFSLPSIDTSKPAPSGPVSNLQSGPTCNNSLCGTVSNPACHSTSNPAPSGPVLNLLSDPTCNNALSGTVSNLSCHPASNPVPSGLHSKLFTLPLSVRTSVLQLRFLNVPARFRHKTHDLHSFYKLQAANLQSDRQSKMLATQHAPWLQHAINGYYDYHHHLLISRVEKSLSLTEEIWRKGKQEYKQPTVTQCNDQMDKSNNPTRDSSQTAISHSSVKSVNKQKKKNNVSIPRDRRARFVSTLNPVAVKIMVNWYQKNKVHPYQSLDTCTVMAKAGDISVGQVKKWFANKRQRDNNTRCAIVVVKRRRRSRDEMEESDAEFWSEGKRQRTE